MKSGSKAKRMFRELIATTVLSMLFIFVAHLFKAFSDMQTCDVALLIACFLWANSIVERNDSRRK